MGIGSWLGALYKPAASSVSKLVEEPASVAEQRANLAHQGRQASDFASWGEQGFHTLGAEGNRFRGELRDRMNGQNSLSAEQLRQGLGQLYGQQRSMAASASPQNAAMAARTAANNMARAGYGMSGQAAMAGIQERNAAMEALGNMITQGRNQELQAALGSRQNAISGYGGGTPEKSTLDKYAPIVNAGIGFGAGLK